jgi:carbon starvation protein
MLSAALAFSGKWQKIWPVFGASNQLVAALALFVLSCWLLSRGKTTKFTLAPAFFMLVTTVIALVLQAVRYFRKDNVLFIAATALIVLAGFMVYDIIPIIWRNKLCIKA